MNDGIATAIELFKNESIKFLPIIDDQSMLVNVITKNQMHALLLLDIHADLSFDFLSLDENIVDHEIFQRPWGFYKTTVMNDYFQSKVISVNPKSQLSLQSHDHREEHWIVAHGTGTVQLDQSVINVHCGSSIFIPKGAKHRLTNTDEKESLIITEVQTGIISEKMISIDMKIFMEEYDEKGRLDDERCIYSCTWWKQIYTIKKYQTYWRTSISILDC